MKKENCNEKKTVLLLFLTVFFRFTWGSGEHGQLGHRDPVKETSKYEITRNYMQSSVFSIPKKVVSKELEGKRVKQVSCGIFHTVLI